MFHVAGIIVRVKRPAARDAKGKLVQIDTLLSGFHEANVKCDPLMNGEPNAPADLRGEDLGGRGKSNPESESLKVTRSKR